MSGGDTAEARIEALELHAAHQERVIEDLNAAVTEQWKRIDGLARQFERVTDRLQRLEERAPPSGEPEPPPPHY